MSLAVKQVRNADHVVPKGGTCVVVGAGPVGMRAARELAPLGVSVRVIGAEPQPPYNRVRLTPLLSGDVQFGEILLDGPQAGEAPFEVMLGQRVEAINRAARQVILRSGQVVPYDTLVLATGSSAFVPGIPGRDLAGVYTFRTADDASALLARSFSARRVAVIGGGLLGLEAARGMRRRQCDVTVIEHEGRLMPRQLDPAGGCTQQEGQGAEAETDQGGQQGRRRNVARTHVETAQPRPQRHAGAQGRAGVGGQGPKAHRVPRAVHRPVEVDGDARQALPSSLSRSAVTAVRSSAAPKPSASTGHGACVPYLTRSTVAGKPGPASRTRSSSPSLSSVPS